MLAGYSPLLPSGSKAPGSFLLGCSTSSRGLQESIFGKLLDAEVTKEGNQIQTQYIMFSLPYSLQVLLDNTQS